MPTQPRPDPPETDPAYDLARAASIRGHLAQTAGDTRDFAEPGEELAISARGIEVDASWGHVYGPVDLNIRHGGLTVLVGSGGRGLGRGRVLRGSVPGAGRGRDWADPAGRAFIARL